MSISQIANIAGVSEATVSRVLNNKPGPSARTVEAVSLAARETGYLRKRSRRHSTPTVKGVKNGLFAFLAFGTSSQETLLTVIRGIENTLTKKLFNLSINFIADGGSIPKSVVNGSVDGVFLFGNPNLSQSVTAKLKKIPSVWLMYNKGDWGSHFTPDNTAIGEKAGEYVLSRACRNIAILMAGKETAVAPFAERAKGFKKYINSAGGEVGFYCSDKDTALPMVDNAVYSRIISEEIETLLDKMLSGASPPEAIFVPNDREVATVYQQLAARGIKPGIDTLIVTCDGHNLSLIHPSPVVVDIRADLVGKYAAEYLLTKIAQDEPTGDVKMLIQPELNEIKPSGN